MVDFATLFGGQLNSHELVGIYLPAIPRSIASLASLSISDLLRLYTLTGRALAIRGITSLADMLELKLGKYITLASSISTLELMSLLSGITLTSWAAIQLWDIWAIRLLTAVRLTTTAMLSLSDLMELSKLAEALPRMWAIIVILTQFPQKARRDLMRFVGEG